MISFTENLFWGWKSTATFIVMAKVDEYIPGRIYPPASQHTGDVYQFHRFGTSQKHVLLPSLRNQGAIYFDVFCSFKMIEENPAEVNMKRKIAPYKNTQYKGTLHYHIKFPFEFFDNKDEVIDSGDLVIQSPSIRLMYRTGDKELHVAVTADSVDGREAGGKYVRIVTSTEIGSSGTERSMTRGASFIVGQEHTTGKTMSSAANTAEMGECKLQLTIPPVRKRLPPLSPEITQISFVAVAFRKENDKKLDENGAKAIQQWKTRISKFPQLVQALRDGSIKLSFEGYASDTGGVIYNLGLSSDRIEAVRSVVNQVLGVPASAQQNQSAMAQGRIELKGDKRKSVQDVMKERQANRVVVVSFDPQDVANLTQQ